MIITSMVINNFKQFYGKQVVTFGSDSKKNVTIIYGANGRGKTSLYRALMFCLYGERSLAQDPEGSGDDLQLVNKVAVEEARSNTEVEAYVQLDFVHKNEKYSLKRMVLGILSDGEQHEQMGEVHLSHVHGGNWKTEKDPERIEQIINGILDKRVREYFLFDGEKIERLTRVDRAQKREIENGIKNLLNIDQLIIAKKGFDLLLRDMENQLKKKSTGLYHQEITRLQSKEGEKRRLEEDLESTDHETQHAIDELKLIDQKLETYKDISVQLAKRADIQRVLEIAQKQKIDILNKMITEVNDLGVILVADELQKVSDIIGEKFKKGELPSPMREILVKKILEDGICICKTSLKDNPQALESINNWKNRVMDEKVEENLFQTYNHVGRAIEFVNHKSDDVQFILQNFSSVTEEIERQEKLLKIVSEQIGDQKVNDDIPRLEQTRNEVYDKKIKLEHSYTENKSKLKRVEEELVWIKENVTKLEKEEAHKNVLAKRCNLVRESKEALTSVYEDFTKEIKNKISECATDIFGVLIDQEGKKTFKKLCVSDDYSLELYDWQDKPFLANISAGQRQITSISFITSLARVAGGDDIIELPLFMDSPFGRLSGEHRDKLIENVPNLTKQWILLATDTEFTKDECKKLKDSGRWGRIYVLQSDRPGVTKLVEKQVESFAPIRSGSSKKGE